MNYLELARTAFAEILLVIAALLVLGVDLKTRLSMDSAGRRFVAIWTSVAACGITIGWLVAVATPGNVSGGMFASDLLTRLVKAWIVAISAGTLILSSRITFTTHVGEYVATVLLGTVGMMLVVSSENVMMMFLSLELTSLSLYVLTAFDKRNPQGSEAALKYFLFGGMAGAFLLFGLSLVYGVTGAIRFDLIATGLSGQTASPVWLAGLVMVMVGLGFKIAAAPFHFWAPDAYQGAPAPAAGFIAAGSKVAAFLVLAKITLVAFAPARGGAGWNAFQAGWVPLLAVLAVFSVVWGNLAALRQRNVKRLLAYSAVAHSGYTLIGVIAAPPDGMTAVLFYAGTYALTVLGAFGVVGILERMTGGSDYEHLAGLMRRAPAAALCLGVFMLSLAGIPPFAGFFGKFYLFLAALHGDPVNLGLLWLIGVAAATTCVSFYYYLRVLKIAFVEEPAAEYEISQEGGPEGFVIVTAALLVILLGCAPGVLLSPLQAALAAVGL